MKNIKKLIIIFIILIIVVLVLLLFLLKTNNNNDENYYDAHEYSEEPEEIVPEVDDYGYIEVDDDSIFFSVCNSVERYIDIIQYEILDLDENQNDREGNHVSFDVNKLYLLNIKNENDRLQAIYNLLDEDYINTNKITLNNIGQYVNDINEYTQLIPISMKVKYGENINTYVLNAYLKSDKLVEKKFVIRVNNKNETFSIEFKNDNSSIKENEKEIEKNNFNNFEIDNISDEKIILKYLEYFKMITLDYPEIAYDNYFDEEYREKRFGNVENYKKYINDNIENLKYSQISKYATDYTADNNTYYIGIDQYENTYIFETYASMQYKLKLDNYTIPTDNFKETYKTATNEQRVQMNINKFIQMINRHDYRTSYNCLADSFKNNYFRTEKEFEQFIKNNFFSYNNVTYNSLEEKNSNLYTCELSLTDSTNTSSETKKITIVMQLEDNMEFVMSFSM